MTPIFILKISRLLRANGFPAGVQCDCGPDCKTVDFEHYTGKLSIKINPLIPAISAVTTQTDDTFSAMVIEEEELEQISAFVDLLYTSFKFYEKYNECRVWRWVEILNKRKECGKMFKLLNYNLTTGETVEAEAFVLNEYTPQAEDFLKNAYSKQFPGTQTVVLNSPIN